AAGALDRLESLAHLAWAPPLLCAQAGLQPVRSVQALSQREDLPTHWQRAEASRKCLNLRVATAKIATHLRTFAIAVLILLTANAFAATNAPELQQLQDQLKKAQDAEDKPAIIELSRRIVAIAPNDAGTWDTLAQTQLESDDLDGLERTLDQWQKTVRVPPLAIEDFRSGLCFKRKDYQCAEQRWLACIASKPARADAATDYDN